MNRYLLPAAILLGSFVVAVAQNVPNSFTTYFPAYFAALPAADPTGGIETMMMMQGGILKTATVQALSSAVRVQGTPLLGDGVCWVAVNPPTIGNCGYTAPVLMAR